MNGIWDADLDQETRNLLRVYLRFLRNHTREDWSVLFKVKKFVTAWLEKRSRESSCTGRIVERFKYNLIRMLDWKEGRIPATIRSTIRNFVDREARGFINKTSPPDSRITTFDLDDIYKTIKVAWEQNKPMYDLSAVVLALAFTTGSRTGDILQVYREDIIVSKNNGNKFLKIAIRTSKNNPLGQKRQYMKCCIEGDRLIKTEEILERWLEKYNPKEQVFQIFEKPVTTNHLEYYFKTLSEKAGLDLQIKGHSGRHTVVQQMHLEDVGDLHMKNQCNWGPNSDMPTYYVRDFLDDTDRGAPMRILCYNMSNLNT